MQSASRLHLILALLTLIAIAAPVATARGAVLVEVGSTTLDSGTAGTVDVLLSGAGDPVQFFQAEFRITPLVGATSSLQFVEETELYLADPSYIFVGKSNAAADAIPSSVGGVFTAVLPDDQFIPGDFTSDFSDVTVSSPVLLARLFLSHLAGVGSAVGDQFSIDVVPTAGDSTGLIFGGSETGFLALAPDFTPIPVPYSSTPGTITITGAAPSVPEPSTLLLASLLGALTAWRGRRRR